MTDRYAGDGSDRESCRLNFVSNRAHLLPGIIDVDRVIEALHTGGHGLCGVGGVGIRVLAFALAVGCSAGEVIDV